MSDNTADKIHAAAARPGPPLNQSQCNTVIGGTIGFLCLMTDPDIIRQTVKWWAENDLAWEALKRSTMAGSGVRKAMGRIVDDVMDDTRASRTQQTGDGDEGTEQ